MKLLKIGTRAQLYALWRQEPPAHSDEWHAGLIFDRMDAAFLESRGYFMSQHGDFCSEARRLKDAFDQASRHNYAYKNHGAGELDGLVRAMMAVTSGIYTMVRLTGRFTAEEFRRPLHVRMQVYPPGMVADGLLPQLVTWSHTPNRTTEPQFEAFELQLDGI